jgi:hypothetical protein
MSTAGSFARYLHNSRRPELCSFEHKIQTADEHLCALIMRSFVSIVNKSMHRSKVTPPDACPIQRTSIYPYTGLRFTGTTDFPVGRRGSQP